MCRSNIIIIATLLTMLLARCGSGPGKSNGHAAQRIDSLVRESTNLLYKDPEQAQRMAREAYRLSIQFGLKKGEAESMWLMASGQQEEGNYDSAISLDKKALKIFIEENNRLGIAKTHNDLGISYDFKARYDKALKHYLSALEIFEELKDKRGMINCYNNIGLIHQNQHEYKPAKDNFITSLKMARENNLRDGEANALNSLGTNYLDEKNYDSSLFYFRQVLQMDLEDSIKANIASSYNNLGEAYMGRGRYDSALYYLQQAKKLKEELNNPRALANTLKNLGEVYIKLQQYDTANMLLQEAVRLATQSQVPEIIKEAHILLVGLYEQRGNYEEAVKHFREYERINEEINADSKKTTIAQMEKEYELGKKDNELDRLNHKIEKHQLTLVIYIMVAMLFVAVSGFLYYDLNKSRSINRQLTEYQQSIEVKNEELELKNKEITEQKHELEAALNARTRFLSFMSHEVRTPLNGILGVIDLMLAYENVPPEQEEYLRALKTSADNLMFMLSNILDLNKLEMDMLTLENRDFDLVKVLTEQTNLYKANATKRQNTLEVHTDPELPHRLKGDPYRIAQVISNLVNNAVKFTKKGRIDVRASVLEKNNGNVKVLIEIEDTGIGIPDELLSTIMEPFSQAEAYTTRKYGGTGLGLAICKKLVEKLGGNLAVKSKQGAGSTFSFILTFDTGANGKQTLQANGGDSEFEGMKVLIAEDNALNAMLIEKIARQWKIETEVVADGYKTLEKVEQKKYDMLFMDLHMPGLTGYEVAERIKAGESPNKNTPILAITAASVEEVQTNPLRSSLDDVMYKPILQSELYKHIKKLRTA